MVSDTFDKFQTKDRGLFGDNETEQVRPGRGPRVTGASDLHDLTLILKAQTAKAIGVIDPAKPELNNGQPIWLPKSQVEFEHGKAGTVVVTIPEWLAKDKGLI
jgi:hypothetical protein